MASIRTFETPALALRPTETGVEATAATARRVGGFYNQQASALQQLGRDTESLGSYVGGAYREAGSKIGGGITAAGDSYVNFMDHKEISHGAATFAEMQDNLTNKWNDFAKNSDPNDPSVAAKFRETVLQPALDNFTGGGFTTEKSQQWAEGHAAALREHMFQKTSADMSTLAGVAVRQNVQKAAAHMSNTALNDPSSVPFLLESVDHSVGGIVGSSPNISAVDAARVNSEVSTSTKAAIVKYGAIGAIQKSGDPERTAEEWTKKYPDYIDGAEAKTLASNARQQIRARNYDYETNRRRNKEIAQDKSTEATNQYLIDVRSQDPRLAGDPTAKRILNDTTLTKTDKNNLLNLVDRQLKPETDARLSQQTFVGLLREMRAPDADPEKVMQKAWDARLLDPGKPGSMSEKDFNQFRAEVVARKTPDGAALEHDRGQFFKNYGTAIAGPSYTPAIGDPKVYNAEMDARRVEADLKKKGLDPHLAYDPASPYFLGDPKRIAKWSSSMQQDLQERATAPKSVNLTGDGSQITGIETKEVPISRDAPRTAGSTYMTPMGQMKWTGTGWVKP
jgi:hypothetical protein